MECRGSSALMNGTCVECTVLGCQKCLSGSVCETCMDKPNANLIDGECVCYSSYKKPSSKGLCETCYVDGCASCVAGWRYSCHQCLDSKATLENGKCVCPAEYPMNDDGVCQKCSVVGCTSCETGKDYSCEECESWMVKDGEVCACQSESKKLNPEGECELC